MSEEKEEKEFLICIESYLLGMLEGSKFSRHITESSLNNFIQQASAIELQLINFRTTGNIDKTIGLI